MSPREFYAGFTQEIQATARRIADEETEKAIERIKERVAQEVTNFHVAFEDTMQRAADNGAQRLEVKVVVNFTGLPFRRT